MIYAPRAADLLQRPQGHARRRSAKIETQPVQKGTFGFAGVDDHYFLSAVVPEPDRVTQNYASAVPVPDSRPPIVHLVERRSPRAAERRRSSSARRIRRAAAIKPTSCARSTSACSLAGGAAAQGAEVGQRLRRQLRLVDHRPHGPHQPGDVPAPHKSVVSMRKMQEIQPQVKAIQDRYAKLKMTDPGAPEDERRGDGALQAARRQSGERLRADAAHPPGPVCVLRDAVGQPSSCAARRSSAGSPTCRCTIRSTSRRC